MTTSTGDTPLSEIQVKNPSSQELRNTLTKLIRKNPDAPTSVVLAVDDHTGDVYELVGVELFNPEPATRRSKRPSPITMLKMVRQ